MTDTQTQGKEIDLFANDKPKTQSFTPDTTTPTSPVIPIIPEPPPIKVPEIKVPPISEAPSLQNKLAKGQDDVNPQMTNLIKEAEKRNAALTARQRLDTLPDLAHKVAIFKDNSAKVLQILRDHGMDSQQAEKALVQLLKLE